MQAFEEIKPYTSSSDNNDSDSQQDLSPNSNKRGTANFGKRFGSFKFNYPSLGTNFTAFGQMTKNKGLAKSAFFVNGSGSGEMNNE